MRRFWLYAALMVSASSLSCSQSVSPLSSTVAQRPQSQPMAKPLAMQNPDPHQQRLDQIARRKVEIDATIERLHKESDEYYYQIQAALNVIDNDIIQAEAANDKASVVRFNEQAEFVTKDGTTRLDAVAKAMNKLFAEQARLEVEKEKIEQQDKYKVPAKMFK